MPDERRPIRILSSDLANKIAAGEVVERPASVVKELVENSIDAGSTRIEVEVRDGGKEYIRVTDNGCGMLPDEVTLAFLRHATSKISSAAELDMIGTLGFRGEALPSIASCSAVEVISRPPAADVAIRLVVKGGVAEAPAPAAGPPGTSVTVRRLFYNAPARYKFLKQSATEKRYIAEYMMHMALAQPQIAYKLHTEVGLLMSTPGGGDLLAACSAVHGKDVARRLMPVAWDSPFASVSGFVAPPDEARHNRGHESIFINGRWVQNRMLYAAVEKGYDTTLPARRYPVVVLHVEMDPTLLDVNVHPAKTEVRFRHESETFKQLMSAVKAALSNSGPTVLSGGFGTEFGHSKSRGVVVPAQYARQNLPLPSTHPASWTNARAAEAASVPYTVGSGGGMSNGGADSTVALPTILSSSSDDQTLVDHLRQPLAEDEEPAPEAVALRTYLPEAPLLGQVLATYLVLAAPEGMWLIDQHVAHERVLYERILNKEASHAAQLLLTPVPIQLSAPEATALEEVRPQLVDSGIVLEAFGPASYLVRALPLNLAHVPGTGQLRELLADAVAAWESGSSRLQEKLAANLACRAAIKAGKPLDTSAQRTLLSALAATANPFACPHGRPIIIAVDRAELERRFGRR